MGDRDGMGCSVLVLVTMVAVAAFLLGRATAGWFADPPRSPVFAAATAGPATVAPTRARRSPVATDSAAPSVRVVDPTPRAVSAPATEPARRRPTAAPAPIVTVSAAPAAPAASEPTRAAPARVVPTAPAGRDTRAGCHPSYPTICIPPPPPDGDCGLTTERNFPVLPPDPHNLDSDRDGVGCEPIPTSVPTARSR